MLCCMIQSPESLKKVRAEFKRMSDKETMNFSLLCENKCDLLDKVVTLEGISDLEYLSWTTQEALRMHAPAHGSTYFHLS